MLFAGIHNMVVIHYQIEVLSSAGAMAVEKTLLKNITANMGLKRDAWPRILTLSFPTT